MDRECARRASIWTDKSSDLSAGLASWASEVHSEWQHAQIKVRTIAQLKSLLSPPDILISG